MQESMEDAIAAESEFQRCNSENHRHLNQNFSKHRPQIQGKIRISQLTFNPVKTVHKIILQNTVQLNFIDSTNSRSRGFSGLNPQQKSPSFLSKVAMVSSVLTHKF